MYVRSTEYVDPAWNGRSSEGNSSTFTIDRGQPRLLVIGPILHIRIPILQNPSSI